MNTFTPGSRVCHPENGLGTVVRSSQIDAQTSSACLYIVEYDKGGFVTYTDVAADARLMTLPDNDVNCPACGISLQGGEVPKHQQLQLGATHRGRQIRVYDEDLDECVAFMCPDCKKVWSVFTGKIMKRVEPFWWPFNSSHPVPISELGLVHRYNVRAHRRAVRPSSRGDYMDASLTSLINRQWYLLPIIKLIAPIWKRRADRARKELVHRSVEALDKLIAEATDV